MSVKGYHLSGLGLIFFAQSLFAACPKAVPVSDEGFCNSFQMVAECHCMSSGLPQRMCNNVQLVYQRMIATFGSMERACRFQKDTTYQDCMNNWQCYLKGGTTPEGYICNASGAACV